MLDILILSLFLFVLNILWKQYSSLESMVYEDTII